MRGGFGSGFRAKLIAARLLPARDHVPSFHFVASLWRFKTRRKTGTAIYDPVQPTNLHGVEISGLLTLPDPSPRDR